MDQSIALLYQTYKNLWEKVLVGLIKKVDKDFAKELDFKDIKFPVKISDIHKIGENKKYQKMYVDLLLIGEGERHFFLTKDFNTFMYDHTLHCGRKLFDCNCLQAYSAEEIL